MKIIQITTSISYGDAVSNDILAINDTLNRNGYETAIYAEGIGNNLPKEWVKHISRVPKLKEQDIIIYHLAIGTELNYKITEYKCKKILVYHNVTPCEFFINYNTGLWKACKDGREVLKFLSDKVDYCFADSHYNKMELEEVGFQCKIDVLPILIPFKDYEKTPNEKIIQKYSNDGYTNILFTGRIAPNKKQEDIIAAFYMYQKYYNPKSRLFLVGSYNGMETYYQKLQKYVEELNVENVHFTGHIKFDEILAYYRVSNMFLCMSEHEGFCVPLVEAMQFEIPIVAYNSTAVGETLNNAGILLEDKNPLETAGVMHYILENENIRTLIKERQKKRITEFAHDKIEKQFISALSEFLGK